jgi:hypothetical protein
MKPALKVAVVSIVVGLCAWTTVRVTTERGGQRGELGASAVLDGANGVGSAAASSSAGGIAELGTDRPSSDRSAFPSFRGRVIEAESGAAVADCVLQIVCGNARAGECRSDANGRFSLALPDCTQPAVLVLPPLDCRALEPVFEIADPAREAQCEHVFHVSRGQRSRVRGVLVDSTTREPLPDCYFELSSGGLRDITHSDEQGRFTSDLEFERGRLSVRAIEENPTSLRGGDPLPFDHAGVESEGEVLVPVLVGPSWKLVLEGAPALDASTCEASIAEDRGKRWVAVATIHAGDPSWVRFPSWTFHTPRPWRVQVRSRDRLWAGEVEVDEGRAHGGLLVVPMSSRGFLVGKITDIEGEPVAQAKVWLTASESDPLEEHAAEDESSGNGRYVLGHLAPGTYGLHVASDRFAAYDLTVAIRAGRESACDVQLGKALPTSPIRGIVRSQSGRFTPQKLHAMLQDQ